MSLARNIGNLPNGDGAPVYACRAWVNFNGKNTVAIGASGNVSSITDNGTGDYTVNFTTAMPDVNYAVVSGSVVDTGNTRKGSFAGPRATDGDYGDSVNSYSTSSIRIAVALNGYTSGNPVDYDPDSINIAIFR